MKVLSGVKSEEQAFCSNDKSIPKSVYYQQYSLEEQLCHSYWLVSLPRGVGAVEVVLREVAGLMEGGVLKTAAGQALVGIQQIVLSHVV